SNVVVSEELDELVEVEIEEVPHDAGTVELDDIHLPPPSIAPLIVGIGVTLLLTGLIAPLLGVIGLVITVVGGLRMARFPEVEMPAHFLKQINNRKFGMWAFIASEVMFFTSLIATFISFKLDHEAAFKEAHEVLSLPLATIGTTVLIFSSFAVVMGLEAIQSSDRRVFFNWMGLTILFGAMFLGIQAFEWYELMHEGIKADDVFGTVFFSTTGFHGLHVLGGVVWLSLIMLRASRGEYSAENNLGIEIFGLYWHFVDVVWIVLFTVIYLIS
ncbi:MAG: heme-copper oxidase subunit III, partial [Chloroflexi bacterium]